MTSKMYLTLIETNRTRVNVDVRVSPLSAWDLEVSADPKAPYTLDSYAREIDFYTSSAVGPSFQIRRYQVVICFRVAFPFDARCE